MAVRKTPSAASNRRRSDKTSDLAATSTGDIADRVSVRAYELFLARGCVHGHDLDDWLEAEREVSRVGQAQVSSAAGTLGAGDRGRPDSPSRPS
jgi:hypothetical protein